MNDTILETMALVIGNLRNYTIYYIYFQVQEHRMTTRYDKDGHHRKIISHLLSLMPHEVIPDLFESLRNRARGDDLEALLQYVD